MQFDHIVNVYRCVSSMSQFLEKEELPG